MARYLLYAVFGLLLTGCSGPQQTVKVSPEIGEKVIAMKASSFDFNPDIIKARQGDRLVFEIENVSGFEHNFTLKNPAGEILIARDLPEHEIVQVELSLAEPGEYPFYCDKPLHATFGMKGRLIVEP